MLGDTFWASFEKRGEVLTDFSESSSAGGTADDINNELELARSKRGPELAQLTVDADRGPKGGTA